MASFKGLTAKKGVTRIKRYKKYYILLYKEGLQKKNNRPLYLMWFQKQLQFEIYDVL